MGLNESFNSVLQQHSAQRKHPQTKLCFYLCFHHLVKNNDMHDIWPLTSQFLCVCSGIWALWTRKPVNRWEKQMDWWILWWSTSRPALRITRQKTRWDQKRWSWIKVSQSLIFTVCINLSMCVCIFLGGGKCNVCLEESLLPDLQWDASICFAAPRRTKQSSKLREGWSHWLLHTSEQESQKCTHKLDSPIH